MYEKLYYATLVIFWGDIETTQLMLKWKIGSIEILIGDESGLGSVYRIIIWNYGNKMELLFINLWIKIKSNSFTGSDFNPHTVLKWSSNCSLILLIQVFQISTSKL